MIRTASIDEVLRNIELNLWSRLEVRVGLSTTVMPSESSPSHVKYKELKFKLRALNPSG